MHEAHIQMAMLRLIERAFSQPSDMPNEYWPAVRSTLISLATDPDPDLAADNPPEGAFGHNDPLRLSLNHVRPRAVALLISYAARKVETEQDTGPTDTPEVVTQLQRDSELRELLTDKLDIAQEPSWAVRSVFGQNLPLLQYADAAWLNQNFDRILPESNDPTQSAVVYFRDMGYLLRAQYFPSMDLLAKLRPKYLRAIRDLAHGPTTIGLVPVERLAEHVIWEYLHSDYAPQSDSDSHDLVVVFFQTAPSEARSHAARTAWQACCEQPQKYWPKDLMLWDWRVACAIDSTGLDDFAGEMAYFAQFPKAVAQFVDLPSIESQFRTTLSATLSPMKVGGYGSK